MSHRSFWLGAVVSMLLFSASVRSQEAVPKDAAEERAEMKKKATDLLLTVAGQVQTLRSAENRARIGSNAAEALWDHDEQRARTLFAAVGDDLRTGFADADPDPESHTHTLEVFRQLRSETLARIAKHDPELALEFLRATRPTAGELADDTDADERALELRLAGQVAAKNPELALKLARASLAQGFSVELLLMLSTLQSQNKEASLTFYQEVVDKLKNENAEDDSYAIQFALMLALQFQPPRADERVYRDLIGLLLECFLASGCEKAETDEAAPICYQLGSMFFKARKYYGQRAAPLKRWAPDEEDSNTGYGWWERVREVSQKGTVDEIVAFMEKNPSSKYQLSWEAIAKARAAGDFARARQIVSEYVDERQSPRIMALIDQDEKRASTNPDNPASIQQALSTFRNEDERIRFLLVSANNRLAANDRKAALLFINQAAQIIDSSKGKTQLEGQVALAFMYCSLKSNRSFTIIESLIPRLNQLVAAAAALDGVETNYLRDEEWNMTGQGELGKLLTDLAQNAGWFARLDFERSVNLVNQLERHELRLMAQLKIAQGVLSEQPDPIRMPQAPPMVY